MACICSSDSNFHVATLGSSPLPGAANTPLPPDLAISDSSQRIDLSATSQGVSSLFSSDQIEYFTSFVEQVRAADKDNRRQLITFIANETLKALDGATTSALSRANRSAYLKNVREWFRTRVRKRKQEYGYGHPWKAREVFYRTHAVEVMLRYRQMVSSLPSGKLQAIAKAMPVDADGLETAAAEDDGEDEEEEEMDVSTPMNVRVVQIAVFQRALSQIWNALPPEERSQYYSLAQKWRLQGPTEDEKRRLADKDIGSITAAFQTDLFVQMGALSVTTVAWVNTEGRMEVACLEGHPRLIGRSFKKECLGTVIPGLLRAFGTWAHPILMNPTPPEPVDPSRPRLVIDNKGKRKFVWPMNERGVPILSRAADLIHEGEQPWVVLPAATRSYVGLCYGLDTGDRSGTSLSPPFTYMTTNIRDFLSEQSLPDAFVKPFTAIGTAGVPALTSLLDYWYGLQERGIDPLVFKAFATGTGERKRLQPSIPREVFRASDLIVQDGMPRYDDAPTRSPTNDIGAPAQIHLSPIVARPRVCPSFPVISSQTPGDLNGSAFGPGPPSSRFDHPNGSVPHTTSPLPHDEVPRASPETMAQDGNSFTHDFIEHGGGIGGIFSHDVPSMATASPPPAMTPDHVQVITQPAPSQLNPPLSLSTPTPTPSSPIAMDIQAEAMSSPHPESTTQASLHTHSHPSGGPLGYRGRRTELQILQDETRKRFGDVPTRRVRRVKVRDG